MLQVGDNISDGYDSDMLEEAAELCSGVLGDLEADVFDPLASGSHISDDDASAHSVGTHNRPDQAGASTGSAAHSLDRLLMPPPSRALRASSVGARSAGDPRGVAEVVVIFEHNLGKIAFYARSNKFEATCHREGHIACRLTRSCTGGEPPAKGGAGRPLGLLAAWLLFDAALASKEEHANPYVVLGCSKTVRQFARRKLRLLPNGAALETKERRKRDDESSSEPEEVPVYLRQR